MNYLSASRNRLAIGWSPAGDGLDGALQRFEQWMADPDSPIRAIRRQPAREGEFAEIPESIAPALREALEKRGIARLYTHQAEAFTHATEGATWSW